MRIRVAPKGTLAARLDRSAPDVELPEGSTVSDLVAHLGLPPGPYVAVVGGRAVSAGHTLGDGDDVALHPPMAGG